MELSTSQIIQAVVAAFLVGFSKTGVVGLGVVIVPLIASVFPGKESTGALLPMLIFGDLFAVAWYRQHAQWRVLARILPWVLPGIVLGTFALKWMPKEDYLPGLGVLILVLVLLELARRRGGEWLEQHLPRKWWFSAIMGTIAGFLTTVGNVAGPVASIYLLSMGLDKRAFMGTGAWYYLIGNCVKVPSMLALGYINTPSLFFNLKTAPLILIGAVVGILTFRFIPQKWFNRAILLLAALSALRLIFAWP